MKSKLLKFVLLLIVTLLLLDFSISKGMDFVYKGTMLGQTGGKINYYEMLELKPEILVMGSSRANYHVIPDSLHKSAFNLGHFNMELPFHTALLSILVEKKKVSPILLLQIDHDFFLKKPGDFNYNDVNQLSVYYNENRTVKEYINRISIFEFLKYYFSTYRYNGKVLSIIKNYFQTQKNSQIKYSGFEYNTPSEKDSSRTLYTSERFDYSVYGKKMNPKSVEVINTFIKLCKDNNITLICFTSPVFGLKSSYFKPSYQYLDSLFQKNNIRYFDYTRIGLPQLNNPKLWRDNRHLNQNGAKIFSSILSKQIQSVENTSL